jgi:hypothetical protein
MNMKIAKVVLEVRFELKILQLQRRKTKVTTAAVGALCRASSLTPLVYMHVHVRHVQRGQHVQTKS